MFEIYLASQINKQTGQSLSLDRLKKMPNIFETVEGRAGLKRAIQNAKGFNFNLGADPSSF